MHYRLTSLGKRLNKHSIMIYSIVYLIYAKYSETELFVIVHSKFIKLLHKSFDNTFISFAFRRKMS